MESSDVAGFDPDYIKTIVFTAIATTRLLKKDYPGIAKITGLCFIAIDKAHLGKDLRGSILNKLSITCNPGKKIQINPKASERSGKENR